MTTLRTEVDLGLLNENGREYLPGYLGIEMLSLAHGTATSRMPVRRLHFAPSNFLHAASIVALADTTCGYATIADLPADAESFTTVELKSNHLGTVQNDSIACTASAQHLGRTTQKILWPTG